jgi:hypothetical protein
MGKILCILQNFLPGSRARVASVRMFSGRVDLSLPSSAQVKVNGT